MQSVYTAIFVLLFSMKASSDRCNSINSFAWIHARTNAARHHWRQTCHTPGLDMVDLNTH